MTLYYHCYYKDVKPGLWNIWSTNDLNKLKGYLSGDNKTTFIRDDITCTIDPRYITVHYSAIEHGFESKTSVTLLNSRKAHMPRPNGRDKGVLRELLGEKWPLYIRSALDNLTCYTGICPWTSRNKKSMLTSQRVSRIMPRCPPISQAVIIQIYFVKYCVSALQSQQTIPDIIHQTNAWFFRT